MAERPDLDYVLPILHRELAGRAVTGVRVRKPVVLRVTVPGRIDELLRGKRFAGARRQLHFARFDLGDLELVVAPMLAGRFLIAAAGDKDPGDLAVALALDDGRELRYRDDVQMGKVYVIARGHGELVPGLDAGGADVLARSFSRAAFRKLARARKGQAKVFLMDKAALDAFGNAYADEALHAAGVHPKTWVRDLDDKALDRLHDALVATLRNAAREIARRTPPLDEKLRDFLAVRNRHGQPCPRCGTIIRKAGVHGHDAFFCPACQTETRKGGIVSWTKSTPPSG